MYRVSNLKRRFLGKGCAEEEDNVNSGKLSMSVRLDESVLTM